jgi:hypothetical protein
MLLAIYGRMRRLAVLVLVAVTLPRPAAADGRQNVRAAITRTGRGLRVGAKGLVGGVLGAVGGIGGGMTGISVSAWAVARGRPQWLLSDRLSAKAMSEAPAALLPGKGQGQAGNLKKAVLNIAQFSVVGAAIGYQVGAKLTGRLLGEAPCVGDG